MSQKGMSRRQLLKLMGMGAAGVVLAACKPKIVEVTKIVEKEKIVKETVIVEKEVAAPAPKEMKKVKVICHDWVRGELPIDRMLTDYNAAQTDHQIVYERTVTGWDKKVLSAIRAGTNELSGLFQLTACSYVAGWTQIGLIESFDDYLNASSAPGADKVIEDMLLVVKGQCIYEGKLNAFPIDFDETGMGYRTDLFEEIGVDGLPGTWEEVGEVAAEIRERFKDNDIYGISSAAAWGLWGGPGGMFYNISKQVFGEDDIVRYDSEEFIWCLELCKSWADRDIAAQPFGTMTSDHWISGKLGIFWNQHPIAIWAQNNLGKQNVSNPQPLPLEEKGSGCYVWAICYGLVNKAPHPQEFVDYLVTTYYPGGDVGMDMNKKICGTGKLPAYETAYDEIVNKDEGLAWMVKMGEIARKAVPPVLLTTYDIQMDRQRAWSERFFAGEMGAKEAMDNCMKEIKAEIAKMR